MIAPAGLLVKSRSARSAELDSARKMSHNFPKGAPMTSEDITHYLQSIRKDAFFIDYDVLEVEPFDNKDKTTVVEIVNPEFTSLCPRTGLPDYGTIRIKYVPEKLILELKSLKYYFLQYRNTGIFYENLTQMVLKHLAKRVHPIEMTVEAEFTPRGGLTTKVVSRYKK
jgi:7-cyano-7-deazaguanine reductase